MKNTVFEMKSTLIGIDWNSNRLDITEEKTSELDDITMKLSKMKYIEKDYQCCRTSNGLIYTNRAPEGRRKGRKICFKSNG